MSNNITRNKKHTALKKIFCIFLSLSLILGGIPLGVGFQEVYADSEAMAWKSMGAIGSASSPINAVSTAVDSNGILYVLYKDSTQSNKATVKKYDGTNWETLGAAGFSAGEIFEGSIAVDYSGKPYVAYRDAANSMKATVMTFDGDIWENVGSPGFSQEDAYGISMALDSSGVPYVAYRDAQYNYKATVQKYDETNGWSNVGNPGFSVGGVAYISIAIASDKTPYVAYGEGGDSFKATVRKYDEATGWSEVGSAFSSGYASFISLALDNSDIPYVAYGSEMDFGTMTSELSVKKYEGTGESGWSDVGSPLSSNGDIAYISLKLHNGIPYIAYITDVDFMMGMGKAAVKGYTGGDWTDVGFPGDVAGSVHKMSMSITPSGKIYVAYTDADNDYTTSVMEYTAENASDFIPVTGILGAAATTTVGTDLTLSGTVAPANATNKDIAWSIYDAGTTGATIHGGVLSTTGVGTVTVRATIAEGLTETSDYTQDFVIVVTNATEESSDATLSGLALSSGSLSPVFSADTTSYTSTVENSVTNITISAGTSDNSAEVKVNGAALTNGQASVGLNIGINTITVVVTAQDDTVKTYTITVIRSSNDNNTNNNNNNTNTNTNNNNNTNTNTNTNTNNNTNNNTNTNTNNNTNTNTNNNTNNNNSNNNSNNENNSNNNNSNSNDDASQNAGTETTTKAGDKTITTIEVDQVKLEKKLTSDGRNAVVAIPVNTKADIVIGELNGQMVKNMEDKTAVLQIKTDTATYTLPAQQLNIAAISAQLGQNVALKDIKVQVEIAKATNETAKLVEDSAAKGSFSIVASPVEFTIRCSSGDKTVEVSSFNAYVERTIAIPEGVDPSKITTGIVVDPDGTVRHVPTRVTVIDGKYYAVINSLTNSTYSVVWHPLEFADAANHWAKAAINDMGSRMVIAGTDNGMFEPDKEITRGEFAAIVVRALGLKPGMGSNPFSDVSSAAWYCDYVKTAVEYGIITGYDNGKFGPNDKITREQAMTMIGRAMKLTGLKPELESSDIQSILSSFVDSQKVGDWATESLAACIKSEISEGKNGKQLAAKDQITRAEVAVMIQRLLQKSKLI